MSILTVGAGQQFTTIGAAVAASRDGDTVRVQAGTYLNDFATVNTKITIESAGGLAQVIATQPPPDGKAIFTTNADVTLRGLEISGAKNSDNNGAGIRYQAGNLVVDGCYIHDNQDGILANSNPAGSVTITGSEIAHNGAGDGQSHNIYINDVGRLTIDRSYFHDAVLGHEIKSRAENTTITNSRIFDGGGDASYSIDVPQGGNVVIRGNVIEQGPNSSNPFIIAYGEEGSGYGFRAGRNFTIADNTIVNHLTGRAPAGIMNPAGIPATVTGNILYGMTQEQFLGGQTGTISGNTVTGTEPALDHTHIWETAPAPPPPPPPADDTLVVRISADVAGSMRFVASLDGKALGAPATISKATDGSGGQVFTFTGRYGTGPHVASVAVSSTTPGQTHVAALAGLSFDGKDALAAPVQLKSGSTEMTAVNSKTSFNLVVPTTSADRMLPVLQGMLS